MQYADSYSDCSSPEPYRADPTDADIKSRAAVLLPKLLAMHPEPFTEFVEDGVWDEAPFAEGLRTENVEMLGTALLHEMKAAMARKADVLAENVLWRDTDYYEDKLLKDIGA